MQANQVSISSITGVDVQLEIAGVGSRSFAFIIDWHIRFVLAFAWFMTSLVIVAGALSLSVAEDSPALFAFAVLIPSLAIYFLYHPFVEVLMRGRSPGKRMAGVRIVTRDGDTPGIGAILIRNVFRLVDSLPTFYVLGLMTAFFTAQHVRIGDLAAGTLLVIDHDSTGRSLARLHSRGGTQLDPKLADLVDEVLERWPALQPEKRREIATSVLLKLDRSLDAQAVSGLRDSELQSRLKASLASKAGQ